MEELIRFLQLPNEGSRLSQTTVKVLNETHWAMRLADKDSTRLDAVLSYLIESFRNELDRKTIAGLFTSMMPLSAGSSNDAWNSPSRSS